MLNGWYVYGGRRTWDTETFPREYVKIRAMAAVRDRYVWDIAQGKSPATAGRQQDRRAARAADAVRQSAAGIFGAGGTALSHAGGIVATMKVPEGFEVKLFASEREFPELAKPDQLNFDNRGRLWVCVHADVSAVEAGRPAAERRLLIFEDTDADGRADKCKVFYDKLHCPTGFEFWNGGVLVVDQPRILWLKDTDGDDKADVVVELLDGWASDDTHHTVGAFECSHGGSAAHARRRRDEHDGRNAVGTAPRRAMRPARTCSIRAR